MKLNQTPGAKKDVQAKVESQLRDDAICDGLRALGVVPAALDSLLPPSADVNLDSELDCRDLLYRILYLKRQSLLKTYERF